MIVPREKLLSIRFEVHASGTGASFSFLAHSHSSYINTNYEVRFKACLGVSSYSSLLRTTCPFLSADSLLTLELLFLVTAM